MKKNNITIIGAGYVGMSIATLLSQTNKVIVYDIDKERVELINKKISPIKDEFINAFLKQYNVYATDNKKDAYINADYIIIANRCPPLN